MTGGNGKTEKNKEGGGGKKEKPLFLLLQPVFRFCFSSSLSLTFGAKPSGDRACQPSVLTALLLSFFLSFLSRSLLFSSLRTDSRTDGKESERERSGQCPSSLSLSISLQSFSIYRWARNEGGKCGAAAARMRCP